MTRRRAGLLDFHCLGGLKLDRRVNRESCQLVLGHSGDCLIEVVPVTVATVVLDPDGSSTLRCYECGAEIDYWLNHYASAHPGVLGPHTTEVAPQ